MVKRKVKEMILVLNFIYLPYHIRGSKLYLPCLVEARRERSVARKNINLEILDMSVFDKFTRFDRKDEISLKKTVFDEIRVKVSVDLA